MSEFPGDADATDPGDQKIETTALQYFFKFYYHYKSLTS